MSMEPSDLKDALLKQIVRELRTIFFVLVTIAALLLALLYGVFQTRGLV